MEVYQVYYIFVSLSETKKHSPMTNEIATAAQNSSLAVFGQMPQQDIELTKTIRQNIKSENTTKGYAREQRLFVEWLNQNGLTPNAATLLKYLQDGMAKYKASTILQKYVSIKPIIKLTVEQAKFISDQLKGIKNIKRETRNQAAPMLLEDVRTIVENIDDTHTQGKRDKAIVLLLFFGCMRVSELLDMTVERLENKQNGILVNLGITKTDKDGVLVKGLQKRADNLCPVSALRAYIKQARINEGVILRTYSEGLLKCTKLTRQAIIRMLKKHDSRLSAHSGRVGFINEAFNRGATVTDIQEHANHKSIQTTIGYKVRSDAMRNKAVAMM